MPQIPKGSAFYLNSLWILHSQGQKKSRFNLNLLLKSQRSFEKTLEIWAFFHSLCSGLWSTNCYFWSSFWEGKGAITACLRNSLPTFQLHLFQCQIFIAWGTLWAAVEDEWRIPDLEEHGETKCRRKHILDEGRIRTPVWHWKDIWELSKFDLLWDFEKNGGEVHDTSVKNLKDAFIFNLAINFSSLCFVILYQIHLRFQWVRTKKI